MNPRQALAALLTALACTVAAAAPAAADEAEWLFTPDHVTEIDFELPQSSRDALAADPREYVPATFTLTRDGGTEDEVTYGPLTVGLKLKGNASFRTLDGKAAFKIKFNEYVKQKFQGLKKLTLNNMVQDPTMLHEVLSYDAFRAVGLPGSRTGYAYVRIDGEDYGLYLNLETLDDVSLPRWYASTQHLYEGEWTEDIVPGGASAFEVDEGDDEDLSDLEALIAAVDTWEGVDTVADLEQMTRFWATEKYIGHLDGYSGDPVPNNYYLHSDDAGLFTMLPWGTDWTWDHRLAYGDPGGRMFTQCLADATCRTLYHQAVLDVRATLGAHDFAGLATATNDLIAPWREMDPRRESSLATIEERLADLHEFIAVRPYDDTWRSPRPAAPEEELAEEDDGGGPPALIVDGPLAEAFGPAPAGRLAVRAVRQGRGWLTTAAEVPRPGALTKRVTALIGGRWRTLCRRTRDAAAGSVTLGCPLSRAARSRLRGGALWTVVRLKLVSPGEPVVTSEHRVRLAAARR